MNQSRSQPALVINNLHHRYAQGQPPALLVPELVLAPAEQLVLTGGSGSGKSTLLHLIAGLMEPSEGQIMVCGIRLHALRQHARDKFRGRTIGMVFQTHHLLLGMSAEENVMTALMFSDISRAAHRPRARTLLETLGISTPAQRVDRLSIGQQQRVAIARALACDPALVLADEPTAALDPDNARAALDLLQQACRASGAALLCVTHDSRIVPRFDRTEHLLAPHEHLFATTGDV